MLGGKAGQCALVSLAFLRLLGASEYHGQVIFNGLPVPGAVITATQGKAKEQAATDERGLYSFPDLADGTWTIDIDMTGFARLEQEVAISTGDAGREMGADALARGSDPCV